MSKKIIIFVIVLIAPGYFLWQQYTPKEEGPKTTGLPMRVARYYWPGEYWVEIADKKGWFKEAGLNIQIIDTNPDYYKSLQDMVNGKIDVQGFSLFDVMSFNAGGADLALVINADTSLGSEAVVARQDIENIQDLRGKTIGVDISSYTDYILGVALNRAGLSTDDVTRINVPGEKAADEFIKGTIDAVVTWEPIVTEIIEKANGRKLFDTSEVPGISPNGQTFHRSFIEERPEDVQAYVNVWHKTTQFMKENPKDAFGIIADIYKITPGEAQAFAQVDKILYLRDNLTAFSYGAGFESLHGTARQINNFMINKGMTDKRFDSTEFLDARFIRALKR